MSEKTISEVIFDLPVTNQIAIRNHMNEIYRILTENGVDSTTIHDQMADLMGAVMVLNLGASNIPTQGDTIHFHSVDIAVTAETAISSMGVDGTPIVIYRNFMVLAKAIRRIAGIPLIECRRLAETIITKGHLTVIAGGESAKLDPSVVFDEYEACKRVGVTVTIRRRDA